MKFYGVLNYIELSKGRVFDGTKVCHFEFLGKGCKEFVFLDLTNPPSGLEDFATRFLGVAEIQVDGVYRTPWVYLSDESGNDLEGGARITFSIIAFLGSEVEIVGEWMDFEEEKYPFKAILNRLDPP